LFTSPLFEFHKREFSEGSRDVSRMKAERVNLTGSSSRSDV